MRGVLDKIFKRRQVPAAIPWKPARLFTTGVNGAWYDPSDINLTWRRNLLTYTEQFDNAAWNPQLMSITKDKTASPDGYVSADLITKDAIGSCIAYQLHGFNFGKTVTYIASVCIKNIDASHVFIGPNTWDGAGCAIAEFSLSGTPVLSRTKTVGGWIINSTSVEPMQNGFYRLSMVFTTSTITTAYQHRTHIGFGDGVSSYASDAQTQAVGGVGTKFYIWGAQLELGSTATPYQRITDGIQDYLQYQAQPVLYRDAAGTLPVTAVGQPVGLMLDKSGRGNHAYNPSGNSANFPVLQQDGTGRYYLAFNGVNQWLRSINSIDFTYGDKMLVCAGVGRMADTTGIVCELSASKSANTGVIALYADAFRPNWTWASKGTSEAQVLTTAIYSPVTNVLTGIGDISGKQSVLRVNGTQSGINTLDQGSVKYGNYPLYIGARGDSSLWFNGRLYGMVVAGKQASASEISSTETYLNQKTGAY